jgi:hypothetical protein
VVAAGVVLDVPPTPASPQCYENFLFRRVVCFSALRLSHLLSSVFLPNHPLVGRGPPSNTCLTCRFCVLRASGPAPLAQQHHAHYRAKPAMPARLAPRRHPPVLVVPLSSTVQREVESPALYHRASLRGAASTMEPPAPMQAPVPLPRTMRDWLCSVLAPGTCCRAQSVALGTRRACRRRRARASVWRGFFAPSGPHLLRPSSVATPLCTCICRYGCLGEGVWGVSGDMRTNYTTTEVQSRWDTGDRWRDSDLLTAFVLAILHPRPPPPPLPCPTVPLFYL